MIKHIKFMITVMVIGAISSTTLLAQDDTDDVHNVTITVPLVALLDIAPAGSTITLGATAPTEAGLPLDFSGATDNSLWLNYSSIINTGVVDSRRVTAAITSGTVPGGMVLKVTAGAAAGSGDGTLGGTAGVVTLDGTAQNVVTAIGSCYTGDGTTNGHQLTYALELDAGGNYADLDINDATTLEITYTLTDN